MSSDEPSFFNKERDRLANEIAAGFETLLSSANLLNRKMEDVSAMTKEYHTVASLWDSFHQLMRRHGERDNSDNSIAHDTSHPGLPGTGGHVLSSSKQSQ